MLTIDGEPANSGDLFVIAETDEIVEPTPDGEEIFANLPLPLDLETVPALEGIDLAVVPSGVEEARYIVSAVDAWLRTQGWQPALPSLGAPMFWDYRRWTKDGYQFTLQPGYDDSNNQLWMAYAPLDDVTFGPLPSQDALDVDNLKSLAEVAELQIEGLFVAEAVLSPDGNWLAVTTTDGALYIFDALRLFDMIWYRPGVYYSNPALQPRQPRPCRNR